MAGSFSIRVDTSDVDRRLGALPAKIERACLRKALRSTATKVQRRLRSGTPRGRTGQAARNVQVKVRVRRGGAYAVVKYKGRPAMYMKLRERGGRGGAQPARPFFMQALAGYEHEVIGEFAAALRSAVEGAEAAIG